MQKPRPRTVRENGAPSLILPGMANPIVLYDGVCGLCNRIVQFVLKRDRRDCFRFAPLQGELARKLLSKHGLGGVTIERVCLVVDFEQPGERVLTRSTAVIVILQRLGGFWSSVSILLKIVPRSVADLFYDFFARYRYRIFGKYEVCPLPKPEHKQKFLDLG